MCPISFRWQILRHLQPKSHQRFLHIFTFVSPPIEYASRHHIVLHYLVRTKHERKSLNIVDVVAILLPIPPCFHNGGCSVKISKLRQNRVLVTITPGWSREDVAISCGCWPHHKYVSCLPRCKLDSSLHRLQTLPIHSVMGTSLYAKLLDGLMDRRGSRKDVQSWCQDQALHWNQPATSRYLHAVPLLTAVLEQMKVMAHLDLCDTKHHPESNQQAAKNADCEDNNRSCQEPNDQPISVWRLMNISTGHKAATEDLVRACEIGLEALWVTRDMDSEKVAPVKLATFAAKTCKKLSVAEKAKKIYEEDSMVVCNLYFIQDLTEDKKVDVFSHEWTNYLPSLFEPDSSFEQGYV